MANLFCFFISCGVWKTLSRGVMLIGSVSQMEMQVAAGHVVECIWSGMSRRFKRLANIRCGWLHMWRYDGPGEVVGVEKCGGE